MEPTLLVTPNSAAIDLLRSLLPVAEPYGDIPAVELSVTLRITRADLDRCTTGNGDLATIAFWVSEDGIDAVAFPDPETPHSPFR